MLLKKNLRYLWLLHVQPCLFCQSVGSQGSEFWVNSRNPWRPLPSSVNTGGSTKIMAEGGKLEFVKRIIHNSLQLKKRLRWYSRMLGKKCSLAPLKEELRIQGVRLYHYYSSVTTFDGTWSIEFSCIPKNPECVFCLFLLAHCLFSFFNDVILGLIGTFCKSLK